jgi:peptidoglycan/LPS O-acetylase OafA/YrhL
MVIGAHLLDAHSELTSSAGLRLVFSGSLGVRFFFVISGFLITTLLLRERQRYGNVSLKNFYLRRVLRLWPVQFSFIGFLAVLTVTTPLRMDWCSYLTAVTFTKNYACGSWIDGHLWSLSVEEQFYLVWPPMFVVLRRNTIFLASAFLIAFASISRAIEYFLGSRLYGWLPSNADLLLIGCLLALLMHERSKFLSSTAAWHPVVMRSLATLAMFVPSFLSQQMLFGRFSVTLGPTIQGLCAAFLICSLLLHRRGWSFTLLNLSWVSYLGSISYSLYIWQMPFLSKPSVYGGYDVWFLHFPIDLIVLFGVATISYYLLEKPFVRLRRKLHRHNRQQEFRYTGQACLSLEEDIHPSRLWIGRGG